MNRVRASAAVAVLVLVVIWTFLLRTPQLLAGPPPTKIQIHPQGDSNIAHIRVSDYPLDIFEVYFPEVIHADDRSVLGPGRKNEAQWRRAGANRWVTSYETPGAGDYSIRLEIRGDEIAMEWRARNSSREEWKYVSGTPHFSFAKAPSFHDPALERTYLFIAGKWVPLKEADHSDGNRLWQWYAVKGYRPCKLISQRPHGANSFGLSRDEPELGLVAVVAEDRGIVVGQAFERVQYFVQNVTLGCIHPAGHFGDVPPGKEGFIRGKIYFLRGSLEDLQRRYRKEFPGGP